MQADFLVVGSGSGGAAVARRLADAGAEVLLLEAGPPGFDVPELDDPTRWVSLTGGPWDWGHVYAPAPAVMGRAIPIPRGKVLGGSSSTNAMMWYRGHPADYDDWDRQAPGWTFAECLPAFRACEDWEGGESPLRGAGGPLRITRSPDPHPVAAATLDAAVELGLPRIDDPNGESPEGAALANFNIAHGRRWTAADGYLKPILAAPNFRLLTGARVTGLRFAAGRARAVVYRHDGREQIAEARRGIVLAAGAIETPRLLVLSGIGPEADLARLGIPAVVIARDVGANLQDHPLVRAVNARARQPLPPPRENGGGTIFNWRSDPALDRPDLHAFPIASRSGTPAVAERYGLAGDLFALGVGVMRSHSRGHLTVLTADPDGPLEIQPNFLGDRRDLDALCRAVEWAQALFETRAFEPLFAGHTAPDRRLTSKAEIEAFVRIACSTFFHTCGTARMGADDRAVASPRLSVNGVDGLWIADASVIPVIPSCNTHAPVTMIGERAAGFILEDAA